MADQGLVEQIHLKINRTKEAIRDEQNARDENVNEYLKLAANADKVQLQRIKRVFEKKNQKSAQTIAHLQKKIDNYNKKIKDIEMRGVHGNQTREMLRDVGQGLKDVGANIREGITGLSGGVIGGIKSGISSAGEYVGTIKTQSQSHSHSTKYTSEDDNSSITSGSGHLGAGINISAGSSFSPERKNLSADNKFATGDNPAGESVSFEPIICEMRERREECQRLAEEVESLKTQYNSECSALHQALQEERYRFERLEEQLNDLIELHQNEIENLKQNMTDMEEKVQYQSEERLRDVHEMLESCQTRISKMEHQQHQHLQQLVNLDSLENSNARALILKLINVVLTILQVVLLLVATIANILTPFLQTRVRIVTSIIIIFLIMLVCQQWPDYASWCRETFSAQWNYLSSNF